MWKKVALFGQGFILAPVCVRCLNLLRAIGLVFTYCVILAQCCHMHTHSLTHIAEYLFISQCPHSVAEQKTHMVMSLCFCCHYCVRSSTQSPLDLLALQAVYTLPFNYLYTLINALAHSHSLGQFTLIMFVVFYAAVSTNKINAYHRIPIRQNCVSNSTTQSKYFNNDFSHVCECVFTRTTKT